MSWFDVDQKGLAEILERRGKAFAVFELLGNAWDSGATRVDVFLEPVEAAPYAVVTVVDDGEGFADLDQAFTMFARSARAADPQKRGRFNLGEKLAIAVCRSAEIVSTSGGVRFQGDERQRLPNRRERGTKFRGEMRMTRDELAEVRDALLEVVSPAGVETYLADRRIGVAKKVGELAVRLPTVYWDADGTPHNTARQATVEVYFGDGGGRVLEMGIPVVETDNGWVMNVCVGPKTRVLTADLRYVEAGEVLVGDHLLGFDENRVGHRRSLRVAEVLSVARVRLPSYRLRFDDDTSVVCSADHHWLCHRHGGTRPGTGRATHWVSTKGMRVTQGRRPGTRVVKPLDVWSPGESFRQGYLAAALDGEGCLHQAKVPGGVTNTLTFTQVENLMLARVRQYLTEEGYDYREAITNRPTKATHKPCVRLKISSRQESLRLLGQCRPERLLAKLNIDCLGTLPTTRGVRLVEKVPVGVREVVAIKTTTGTYIAEGLASHNCQKIPLGMDRDNVSPAYLRALNVALLNFAPVRQALDAEAACLPWVQEAAADGRAAPEAVADVVVKRFGAHAVSASVGDPTANAAAEAAGFTVVHGGAMPAGMWANVKKAEALKPAGQVFPTPKPEQLAARAADVCPTCGRPR